MLALRFLFLLSVVCLWPFLAAAQVTVNTDAATQLKQPPVTSAKKAQQSTIPTQKPEKTPVAKTIKLTQDPPAKKPAATAQKPKPAPKRKPLAENLEQPTIRPQPVVALPVESSIEPHVITEATPAAPVVETAPPAPAVQSPAEPVAPALPEPAAAVTQAPATAANSEPSPSLPPLSTLHETQPVQNAVEPPPLPKKDKVPGTRAAVPVVPVSETSVPPPAGQDGSPTIKPLPISDEKPSFQVVFQPTETAVPLSIKSDLDGIAKQLQATPQLRLSLVSYAAATGDQSITARRVSLSRALSVRAYLIDQGVASLRINVQAEGDKNPGGEPNRVDIFVHNE